MINPIMLIGSFALGAAVAAILMEVRGLLSRPTDVVYAARRYRLFWVIDDPSEPPTLGGRKVLDAESLFEHEDAELFGAEVKGFLLADPPTGGLLVYAGKTRLVVRVK